MEFISTCACKGLPPRKYASQHIYERPVLVARLLRERQIARFLIAPDGYGKTSLALQYASLIFSYEHVYWIDCTSPCFIRDLDDVALYKGMHRYEQEIRLAVFDGLESLDEERAQKMSSLIDTLMQENVEIIVTCTPFDDQFSKLQIDRMVLTERDLLLTDDELQKFSSKQNEAYVNVDADLRQKSWRVPFLAWAKSTDESIITATITNETHPLSITSAFFVLCLMGKGSLDGLRRSGLVEDWALKTINQHYTYFSLNIEDNVFCSPELPVDLLFQSFGPELEKIASYFNSRKGDLLHSGQAVNNFIEEVSSCLISMRQIGRSCDVACHFTQISKRLEWFKKHAYKITCSTAAPEALKLYETFKTFDGQDLHFCQAYLALFCLCMGQTNQSIQFVEHVLPSRGENKIARYLASGVGLWCMEEERMTLLSYCNENLNLLDDCCSAEILNKVDLEAADDSEAFIQFFCRFSYVAVQTPYMARDLLCSYSQRLAQIAPKHYHAVRNAYMLVLSWTMKTYGKLFFETLDEMDDSQKELFAKTIASLRSYVTNQSSNIGYIEVICYQMIQELNDTGIKSLALPEEVCALYQKIDREMRTQSLTKEASKRPAKAGSNLMRQQIEYMATYPSHDLAQGNQKTILGNELVLTPEEEVPKIYLKFFGGLRIEKEGRPIDMSYLTRSKVKLLLAILAVDLGRDVPQSKILKTLWPDSDEQRARRNLYTLWGLLRRTFSEGQHECPYLERFQGGYRIDDNIVMSDLRRLETICRFFMGGPIQIEIWQSLIEEIDQLYQGDILPSESQSEMILNFRKDYRKRTSDALALGAQRLLEERHYDLCCIFANKAIRIDGLREDAYVALMEAQMIMGQRVAAMETFFILQQELSEKLGIDPSTKASRLYQQLINDNDNSDVFF